MDEINFNGKTLYINGKTHYISQPYNPEAAM